MTRMTGTILSVDYSLKDQLKGYIGYVINGKNHVIPYYHPKCEKFYPEPGRGCKFTIDDIKIDCDGPYNQYEIPRPLEPTFIEKIKEMIEKWKSLFSKENEADPNSTPVTYGGIVASIVTYSVRGTVKRVAVDLEEDE